MLRWFVFVSRNLTNITTLHSSANTHEIYSLLVFLKLSITSDEKGKKVPVDVVTSIDIFKLVDINEEDYSIEIQF